MKKTFFEKLQSLTEKSKLFSYSKIKTKHDIDEYFLNTDFENRKKINKNLVVSLPGKTCVACGNY